MSGDVRHTSNESAVEPSLDASMMRRVMSEEFVGQRTNGAIQIMASLASLLLPSFQPDIYRMANAASSSAGAAVVAHLVDHETAKTLLRPSPKPR